MFKGEYQGGPFVEVFSAQGRDPISRKCRITGNSTSVHKQYDKDVKSYVYILEGEPTTTKIQLPKDDKQTLFLLQKFLVLQLFIPLGHPFSFELAVSDLAQNKRRIFFSSSQKDITVTPLHAKFPLTVLCLGTWLNLCLDLSSLVEETFNGQTFRALESVTVTANCRLRKIFTLKVPPADTSRDELNLCSYSKTEALPRSLQFTTTPDVRPITQILSYKKLAQKPQDDSQNCPPSSTPISDATTPRQEVETHIAFGSKVAIPAHVRRSSLKDNQENTAGKATRSARSSPLKGKIGNSAPDLRSAREETATGKERQSLKQPGTPGSLVQNDEKSKSVNCSPATIQPRPPRTSSAGKIRRQVRVKSSSALKTKSDNMRNLQENAKNLEKLELSKVPRNAEVTSPSESTKHSAEDIPQQMDTEKEDSSYGTDRNVNRASPRNLQTLENEKPTNSCDDHIRRTSEDVADCPVTPTTSDSYKTGTTNKDSDFHEKPCQGDEVSRTSFANDVEKGSEGLVSSVYVSNDDVQNALTNRSQPSLSVEVSVDDKQIQNRDTSFQPKEPCIDMNNNENNNEPSRDTQKNSNKRERPRILPLASDNPVFTFSSTPRSPRSGKKKLLPSPAVTDSILPVEQPPAVMVSLTDDNVVDNGKTELQRNRGVLFEDDFCKLSDDDTNEDENGIQKLLQSSLSPRHSPMPFHHSLRQSIRSSMLKEIPSPVKENGYDAQNYQSESHLATLNQSNASSWRFDLSDSSNSLSQTHQDLEDSLNLSNSGQHSVTTGRNGILSDDIEDDHDDLSDASDDTTFSTWRAPPQDLRGNKYQNEMKPPGNEPDLTATIDPRDYCDVFSPPIILPSSKSSQDVQVSPTHPSRSRIFQSPASFGSKHHNEDVEEELDLLYDPCLNCYFDPKTHKYYELA